ncbi:XRE family transcriptional regulator [Pseudonocardia sp. ICBG601]|uniref:XRE family transcriptional regulator n=1 Tax=Pseudonocardia sp. ICBG601 TaxID=2846759 RepID=UPI001CF64AA9|nr:XRE family transcriptional regulator [Pseudonocardia sp. ICBG601]
MSNELGERGPRPTLAERLNQAFESVHPPSRGPYSNREAVKWLAENGEPGEPKIGEAYLSLLRAGSRTNPSLRHLQALARFFDLPEEYFISSGRYAGDVHRDLKLLSAMRDAKIRAIALRAADLPEDFRDWLHDIAMSAPGSEGRDADRQAKFSIYDEESGADQ